MCTNLKGGRATGSLVSEVILVELQSLIESYEDLVNRSEGADLNETAERALAEDFRFVGPTVGEVVGREAMLDAMEALHERAPADRIRMNRTTSVDAHNGWFRFGWEFVDENGEVITRGTDVGRIGEEGKLSLVVAFFGDL